MNLSKTGSLVLLHFLVLVWGFTGILGKEISLETFYLVWWRMAIACSAIFLFSFIAHKNLKASIAEILQFGGVGLIIACHWICFFGAIKVSNVSTALAVISTTAFFVAFVSPLINRNRFLKYELILGLLVIAGLFIIFKFEPEYKWGIILSLGASFFAAVFSSFNANMVKKHSSVKIGFYEMLSGVFFLTLFLSFTGRVNGAMFSLTSHDLICLILLGVIATAFAFIAGIEVMKHLSPFTCALAINLEPVYTIALALWIYGESEFMSAQFYFGAVIILSTLFIDAVVKRKMARSTEVQPTSAF